MNTCKQCEQRYDACRCQVAYSLTPEKRHVKFSINDTVRVKLTDEGRAIHRAYHADLYHPSTPPYLPPPVDVDGYSAFQLYDLMHIFGPATYMGNPRLPFEMDIML